MKNNDLKQEKAEGPFVFGEFQVLTSPSRTWSTKDIIDLKFAVKFQAFKKASSLIGLQVTSAGRTPLFLVRATTMWAAF